MAIGFPELHFASNSLEPHISQRTIEIHYGKHHKKYVEKANRLISGTSYEGSDIEEIMLLSYKKDADIFNNVAQAWNHSFFWNCLYRDCKTPDGLNRVFHREFGGMNEFKSKFNSVASSLFGSGWVWLVRDGNDNLVIRGLSNADNPLIHGEIPILTCDVWEHAYYLDYQNQRSEYLKNFWSVVNWDFVEANLNQDLPPIIRAQWPKDELTTPSEFEKARASHH